MKDLIFTKVFKDNTVTLIIDCSINKVNNDLIVDLRGNLNTYNSYDTILDDFKKINLTKYNNVYLDIANLEKIASSNLRFMYDLLDILSKSIPITIIYKNMYMKKLSTIILSTLEKTKVQYIQKGE